MEERSKAATKGKPVSAETVDRLPDIAVKDKLIFNEADQCFYIGKDDKEDN